ncbi:MAG: hypothetical protein L6R41_004439 [Letrouitia leprolyta]|nr:MAG: hypothetical protein L6R41_004439 [Letrouitia leprolyta]
MTVDSAPSLGLATLGESLKSAVDCVPSIKALTPPSDGLSLLDAKNELLLSYLQNLVFLVLFKIRNCHPSNEAQLGSIEPSYNDIVKSLVSLRLYLEKGVRPLESRLKYQLDKLLLVASEASTPHPNPPSVERKSKVRKHRSSVSSASASNSDADNEPENSNPIISDLSHRPNLSAFTRSRKNSPPASSKRDFDVYRPPRITPTALTTTDRPSKASTRKPKNAMLDTFIREELSSAPVAEPSIGADNSLRGRDAQKERERKEYEEMRLVRLPTEGGKKKKGKRERERMGGGFDDVIGGAGEGLGEAVRGGGKRRKVASGGAGGGLRVGEAWERRKKLGVRGLGGKRR